MERMCMATYATYAGMFYDFTLIFSI
jgi:hypothetical protein